MLHIIKQMLSVINNLSEHKNTTCKYWFHVVTEKSIQINMALKENLTQCPLES